MIVRAEQPRDRDAVRGRPMSGAARPDAAPTSGGMRASPMSLRKRVALLLGCIALGTIAGAAGSALSGHDGWYLAIPAAMALGWLFVADPSACGCASEGLGASDPEGNAGDHTRAPAARGAGNERDDEAVRAAPGMRDPGRQPAR